MICHSVAATTSPLMSLGEVDSDSGGLSLTDGIIYINRLSRSAGLPKIIFETQHIMSSSPKVETSILEHFKVYLVEYTNSPRFHQALHIDSKETRKLKDGSMVSSGIRVHVNGELRDGMEFEMKKACNPDGSKNFEGKRKVGVVLTKDVDESSKFASRYQLRTSSSTLMDDPSTHSKLSITARAGQRMH